MNLKYNLMKNLMIKTWKPLLSLLFGVAVVIFWAVPSIAGTTGARIPVGLSLHPAVATDSIPVFILPASMTRAM